MRHPAHRCYFLSPYPPHIKIIKTASPNSVSSTKQEAQPLQAGLMEVPSGIEPL